MAGQFACTVASCLFSDDSSELELMPDGADKSGLIRCVVPGLANVGRGDAIHIQIAPEDVGLLSMRSEASSPA